MARKLILCLDFDGVIHQYSSPWVDAAFIPDPPVEGALEFIILADDHFQICIFSARSHQEGGLQAMKNWLEGWLTIKHGKSFGEDGKSFGGNTYVNDIFHRIRWPMEKPPAHVTIDDRALLFTGVFPSIEELKKFKPWNKK